MQSSFRVRGKVGRIASEELSQPGHDQAYALDLSGVRVGDKPYHLRRWWAHGFEAYETLSLPSENARQYANA